MKASSAEKDNQFNYELEHKEWLDDAFQAYKSNPLQEWVQDACLAFDHGAFPTLVDWDTVRPEDIFEFDGSDELGGKRDGPPSSCTKDEVLAEIRIAVTREVDAQRMARVLATDIAAGRKLDRDYFDLEYKFEYLLYAFSRNALLWRLRHKDVSLFTSVADATRKQMMVNAGIERDGWND